MYEYIQEVLLENSENPVTAFIFFFKYFGMFVMYPFFVKLLLDGWLLFIQNRVKYIERNYVLLSINVPKEDEQSMKAVEQMFAHMYGTYSSPTFFEKWWQGYTQPLFSFEIESDGGYIQFYIRCVDYHQEIVEAAVYAQYPDAEIQLVDKKNDYKNKIEVSMLEDGSCDLYGSEFALANPDVYCIRHWRGWEHSLPGKFVDPMAATLEMMSRIEPGEHIWLQLLTQPVDLDPLSKECQAAIDSFTGDTKGTLYTIIDKVVHTPLMILELVHDIIFGGDMKPQQAGAAAADDPMANRRIFLVEWEREAVSELDMKRSRWPFYSKFRFIYFAKKEKFAQEKVRRGMVGAISQFKFLNNFYEGRWTQVDLNNSWFTDNYYQPFKELRLFWRKRKLIWNMKALDMLRGEHNGFRLNVEELSSLYHFPQIDVRAPFIRKAESRRVEPPTQLNFEGHDGEGGPNVEMQADNSNIEGVPSPVPRPTQAAQVPKPANITVELTPEQLAYQQQLANKDPNDQYETRVEVPTASVEYEPTTEDESPESESSGPPPNLPIG